MQQLERLLTSEALAAGIQGRAQPTGIFQAVLPQSVLAAMVLIDDCGLGADQRVAIYLPNDICAVVWIEAAKRLGAPYVAVASGTSSTSLANRLADTGAAIIVTGSSLQAGDTAPSPFSHSE